MTDCLEYGLPYNPEEEEILYETSLSDYLPKIENYVKGQKKDNDEDMALPLRVTIGAAIPAEHFFRGN